MTVRIIYSGSDHKGMGTVKSMRLAAFVSAIAIVITGWMAVPVGQCGFADALRRRVAQTKNLVTVASPASWRSLWMGCLPENYGG